MHKPALDIILRSAGYSILGTVPQPMSPRPRPLADYIEHEELSKYSAKVVLLRPFMTIMLMEIRGLSDTQRGAPQLL